MTLRFDPNPGPPFCGRGRKVRVSRWCNAVVVDHQVLVWLAEIGRRHGFPVLRLTAEVVEGG